MDESAVYGAIGEEGFARLAAAFYRKVPQDDILGPMYPAEDLHGAEERLRDFLVGRFGGPPRYIEQRGHPRLRMRHMPFALDQAARDRWMTLMTNAAHEAELPGDARDLLLEFFGAMSTFLINRGSEK
jgi:hemoglobin